jgi:small subunit ribosomal protein S8
MVTDTIGDFLTRIRNAQIRNKKEITLPSSKLLIAMSDVLKEEGFIKDFEEVEEDKRKKLTVQLRYVEGRPAIRGLKRVSKPGVRSYIGYRNIKRVLGGIGIEILTTPAGVMTGEQAIKSKVGGELLCRIW